MRFFYSVNRSCRFQVFLPFLECVEYSKNINKKVSFGQLTFGSNSGTVQDVSVADCDLGTELIIGGKSAKAGEFPHMAAIGYPNFNGDIEYKCAGSLISDQFVLTAAHCGAADRARPTMVRLGDLNLKLRETELPEIDIPISKFIGHPNYKKATKQNDIALIKMDRPTTFSKYVRPACLWQTVNIPEAKAVATGWGHTEYAGHSSDDMMKVQLDLLDTGICTRAYEEGGFPVGETQVCAGVLSGGYDTCQGGAVEQ